MADDHSDDYKLTLAQQFFGKTVAILRGNPPGSSTDGISEAEATSVVEGHSSFSGSSPPTASHAKAGEGKAQQKQLKTAADLAEMIELDLARHPDCPKVGFRVTVYGGTHWRAMLTITPAAGGIRNPQEWRDLTNDLAERLRQRYNLKVSPP
ncbi:MAG TPA: hypothetical protein VNR65_13120 [Geobacterales bacterium]|nr:hypothetical protein [Geobacterales bacterium]